MGLPTGQTVPQLPGFQVRQDGAVVLDDGTVLLSAPETREVLSKAEQDFLRVRELGRSSEREPVLIHNSKRPSRSAC